jgi:hypothetical protein
VKDDPEKDSAQRIKAQIRRWFRSEGACSDEEELGIEYVIDDGKLYDVEKATERLKELHEVLVDRGSLDGDTRFYLIHAVSTILEALEQEERPSADLAFCLKGPNHRPRENDERNRAIADDIALAIWRGQQKKYYRSTIAENHHKSPETIRNLEKYRIPHLVDISVRRLSAKLNRKVAKEIADCELRGEKPEDCWSKIVENYDLVPNKMRDQDKEEIRNLVDRFLSNHPDSK